MSNTAKWIVGIGAFFFVLFTLLVLLTLAWIVSDADDETMGTSGQRVAIVELNEPIYSSEEVVRQLKKYRDNRAVKAIVLRVNSPGGAVAASQEIYEEVKKTRDGGKPVVASMGDVAASGGFYVSCGASMIVANPGTLTGSIGVIFQYIQIEELMKKIGVDAPTYKSGRYKDVGSPFRRSTDDDRRFFEQLIADVYGQFVDVVVEERKLERAHVLRYADGRVFTGKQAFEYGFVDTLGTLENAIEIAAQLGGIEGKPRIVKERKTRSLFERMWGEGVSDLAHVKKELFGQPILQYRMVTPY
jgi:protease-4